MFAKSIYISLENRITSKLLGLIKFATSDTLIQYSNKVHTFVSINNWMFNILIMEQRLNETYRDLFTRFSVFDIIIKMPELYNGE